MTTVVLLVLVRDFRSRMTRWSIFGYTDSFTPPLGTLLNSSLVHWLRCFGSRWLSWRSNWAKTLAICQDLQRLRPRHPELACLTVTERPVGSPPLVPLSYRVGSVGMGLILLAKLLRCHDLLPQPLASLSGNRFVVIRRWATGGIVLVGTLTGPVVGMEQGIKRFVRTLACLQP